MGDFTVNVRQKPMDFNRWQLGLVYQCPGHWDDQLKWHQGHMWPQDAILIDLLEKVHAGARSL